MFSPRIMTTVKIILLWIIVLSTAKLSYEEIIEIPSALGRNICSTIVKYSVESEKTYTYTYSEPYTGWCSSFPFRCTKYRTAEREEKKIIIEYKNKTVTHCCKGYKKEGGTCIPVCENGCFNGKCDSPNNCSCLKGWHGVNCSNECEVGRYGENCANLCLCKNEGTCNKINGTCNCTSGFIGEYCETSCPSDTFGKKCENSCKCKNGAICDRINGTCDCLPGYFGKQCISRCEVGSFGKHCQNTCKCKMSNTYICSHIDGECVCKAGWRGAYCEKSCDENTWGPSCLNTCDCGLHGSCHRVTGQCSCEAGWHGPKCAERCSAGFYEKECRMKCPDCRHAPGTCHHETGWCNCPPGATGPTCDLECPEGTYGMNCEQICLCTNNSICDRSTGECVCHPGWEGDECQFPCPEGMYGANCNSTCNCTHRYSCNRFNGNCDCDATDDDPQCLKGPSLSLNETNYTVPAIFMILSVICTIVLVIILAIFLFRRKKNPQADTFSFFKDIRELLLRKSKSNKDSSSSIGKHFENPVYDEINDSNTHASVQSFNNPLAIVHETCSMNLDFKIPDCEFKIPDTSARLPPVKSDENNKSKDQISLEKTTAKYNTDGNVIEFEIPVQNSPIYAEVDLKEQHFEFPSHRLNSS